MAKATHKHRAREKLEALGWLVGDVEKWLPQAKKRIDLFGIIDLVGLKDGQTLGLQVTGPTNVSGHVDKMLSEPRLVDVLNANWIVEVWGVRNHSARDGSFAVTRQFQIIEGGKRVAAYRFSSILP